MKPSLGVCYYPEHWSGNRWAQDAAEMAAAGLSWVRIGEFAWSRIEPRPGEFRWDWLDRAVQTLADAGLRIIMGTPTATPPRWMLDRHPDMLAWDVEGRPRKFGSRRHYCFSHKGYRAEAERIAGLMGERYAGHPAIAAWQIDNEYGCHDTTLSYSPAAAIAFRDWLAERYGEIGALNAAWGNVFWSMEYDSFAQIDPPNLTVTEANPAHVLAFRRFTSDQVVAFNRAQVDVLRRHGAGPLLHNYMGLETGFDHFDVGRDLDIATWDSYPIGFLSDRLKAGADHKARFLRQGDPDFQAFHHDLYRGVGTGRMWVIEQQPGPVNWAPHNPAPLPGMVRLWTWEAFAHGAEAVCYFRWRQAPFAQEAMHAGLLLSDATPAPGLAEAQRVAREIASLPQDEPVRARVALVFDYPSCWAWQAQPQGADFDYVRLCLDVYSAARRLGLSLDVIPARAELLGGYDLVLIPGLLTWDADFAKALAAMKGHALIGPRAGLKNDEMATALPLGPGLPGLAARVTACESLPPSEVLPLRDGGALHRWVETVDADTGIVERLADGRPALLRAGGLHYLAGWPDAEALTRIVRSLARDRAIPTEDLPDGLRIRDTAGHRFLFNYGLEPVEWQGTTIPPAEVFWHAL